MLICSYCCQFISQLLQSWPKHCIERHLSTLQDAVKRGISDADSDARTHSRRWHGSIFFLLFNVRIFFVRYFFYRQHSLWTFALSFVLILVFDMPRHCLSFLMNCWISWHGSYKLHTLLHLFLHNRKQTKCYFDNIILMKYMMLSKELLRAGLCDTMSTVSSTLMWAVLTGPADWVCHIGTLTPCIEAVA